MNGNVHGAHLSLADLCLRSFAYCLVHTVQRPKLHGEKPALEKPSIFVCRHVGFMDPLVLMVHYRKKIIHPLVALDYYEKNGFVLLLFCSGYFNFLLISFDCCIIICPMLSRIAASCSIW